jgi:hypothetical protein
VPGGGVEVLVDHLLQVGHERFVKRSASACSTHSTSRSNACSMDEPTVMMPLGPDIFILR